MGKELLISKTTTNRADVIFGMKEDQTSFLINSLHTLNILQFKQKSFSTAN